MLARYPAAGTLRSEPMTPIVLEQGSHVPKPPQYSSHSVYPTLSSPSLTFGGFCHGSKRTGIVQESATVAVDLAISIDPQDTKRRRLTPSFIPSPSLSPSPSFTLSSSSVSQSQANAQSMGHSTKSLDDTFSLYTDCGSFIESTSLQSHKISKSTKPIVPKVTQRKSLSTFKQPNSSSSSFVAKPIKFINELAPDVPRPKPRLGTYVPTHSAIQQRARKEKRDRGKIKRSDNCFIIYRTHMHPYIVAAYGPQNNEVISKIAGSLWNSTPEWIKDIYRQKAYAAKLLRKEAILESLGSDGGSAGNVSLNEEITIRSTRPSPNPEAIANPKDGANTDDQELGSKYQSSSNEKGWKFHKGTRLPNGRKSGASYIQTTGLTRSDTLMPPQRSIIPEHYSTIPSVELPKVFTFVMQDPSTTVRKHSYVQPSKMPPMFIGPFAGMAPPNSTTTSSSLPLLPSSKLVATDVTLSEYYSNLPRLEGWSREGEALSSIAQSSSMVPCPVQSKLQFPLQLTTGSNMQLATPGSTRNQPPIQLCQQRHQNPEGPQRQQQQIAQVDPFFSALPCRDGFGQEIRWYPGTSSVHTQAISINCSSTVLAATGNNVVQSLPAPATPMLPSTTLPLSTMVIQATQVPTHSVIETPMVVAGTHGAHGHEYGWSNKNRFQQIFTPVERSCITSCHQSSPEIAPLTPNGTSILPSCHSSEYFDLVPPVTGGDVVDCVLPTEILPSPQVLGNHENNSFGSEILHHCPALVTPIINSHSISHQQQQQQEQRFQRLCSIIENDSNGLGNEELQISIEYYQKLLELQTRRLQQAQQQQQHSFISQIL